MGRPSLDTGGEIAVIDLVAHLYSTQGLRRDLCAIWDKYSAATTDERKQKGFEIVRNYHSQLTRMFRDGTFDQHNTVILTNPKRGRERKIRKEKRGAQKSVFFFLELVRVR